MSPAQVSQCLKWGGGGGGGGGGNHTKVIVNIWSL